MFLDGKSSLEQVGQRVKGSLRALTGTRVSRNHGPTSYFTLNFLGLDEEGCTLKTPRYFFGFHYQEAARPGISPSSLQMGEWRLTQVHKWQSKVRI